MPLVASLNAEAGRFRAPLCIFGQLHIFRSFASQLQGYKRTLLVPALTSSAEEPAGQDQSWHHGCCFGLTTGQ